uniref:Uncharacterized protein n=1 Tax=Romanomermis culicivorax TaxID=13658 RepID=A0A915HSM0_ROMCU
MSSREPELKESRDMSRVLILYICFGLFMNIQLIRRNLFDMEADHNVAWEVRFRMHHQFFNSLLSTYVGS